MKQNSTSQVEKKDFEGTLWKFFEGCDA